MFAEAGILNLFLIFEKKELRIIINFVLIKKLTQTILYCDIASIGRSLKSKTLFKHV